MCTKQNVCIRAHQIINPFRSLFSLFHGPCILASSFYRPPPPSSPFPPLSSSLSSLPRYEPVSSTALDCKNIILLNNITSFSKYAATPVLEMHFDDDAYKHKAYEESANKWKKPVNYVRQRRWSNINIIRIPVFPCSCVHM